MAADQTIFRAHRTERDRWTSVLNETIRDSRLSFRATGLLIYLLSLPGDWKASQGQIASCKTEGRDAVITAWNELRKFGYIRKEVLRERGKITGSIWHIFETPESRPTGKPETVQPETVNPGLQSNEVYEEPKEESSPEAKVNEESSIISKEPEPSEVALPKVLDTDAFVEAWEEWVAFRAERRIRPYQVRGANAQLLILAEMGEQRAIAAIKWSIAQQYQGIYEQKKDNNGSRNGAGRNAGTFNAGRSGKFAGVEKLA